MTCSPVFLPASDIPFLTFDLLNQISPQTSTTTLKSALLRCFLLIKPQAPALKAVVYGHLDG
ncbi:hypothetical protein EHS86_05370 [Erwinia amylovora]|nr:hypothetical protein AD997_17605 [Erwinia amylovora]CBJ48100.1 hypothetical protein EAM_3426 [Erwinia amylovora ATCC 49946]CCO80528.1 hypothetical protein BN432_3761 [Erwinia amylovora Ea356]CCO84341.1 hypothetical protein BN433_3797 [Erwinia amylovora Ea266]CCO88094.1 hypothetical protein BN434_3737 [Erwinia amylovora CFBP 2585]